MLLCVVTSRTVQTDREQSGKTQVVFRNTQIVFRFTQVVLRNTQVVLRSTKVVSCVVHNCCAEINF